MADRAGQQLSNYRLVRLLGQGNFTEVYLGENVHGDSQVAIKVLDTQLSDAEVEQFLDQTRTLARLKHPHIVQILDFGVERGVPFVVMDYAPHGTLRQRYPKGVQIPLTTVVSYVEQIASALQYVHDQKLIHCDIKPHNMLLGSGNEIWLSDFDITVVSQSEGYRRKKAREFEGTVPYAAPEQLRGNPRIASDQYALGVMVYEWLTGDWPFHGTSSEIGTQHQVAPPPPLHEKVASISPAVEQVVLKALAKDPYERFESVQAFARALERASRVDRPAGGSPQSLHQFKAPFPGAKDTLAGVEPPARQTLLCTYHGHSDRVTTVAWSPNGQHIASSSLDETIQVWDTATGHTVFTRRSNSLEAQAICWSPDSRYIASTGGLLSETIHTWEAKTGQSLSSGASAYEGHSERVLVVAWSPDGRYLASGSEDRTVQVWEATTKRHIFTYRGHSLAITALAWSPDGRYLASGSEDRTVQVWGATPGSNIRIYYGHVAKVTSVGWSPDGQRIASASEDQTVQVWDAGQLLPGAPQQTNVLTYHGHAGTVTALAWSPDGTFIASGSIDETVQVWDAATGASRSIYRGHSDWVSTVSWGPHDEGIASGSWDKTAQVWQVEL